MAAALSLSASCRAPAPCWFRDWRAGNDFTYTLQEIVSLTYRKLFLSCRLLMKNTSGLAASSKVSRGPTKLSGEFRHSNVQTVSANITKHALNTS